MQTLGRLFGRSPFAPLLTHMAKVAACLEELANLFDALSKGETGQFEGLAQKISKLEHEADLAKNDIRNNLPSGLFLPIARSALLDILSLQDSLADRAEDIAILFTFRPLQIEPQFADEFGIFLKKNFEAFEGVRGVINEMNDLLESSFGGSEARKVKEMVEKVAFLEHESDVLQRTLMKKLLGECDHLPPPVLFLWTKVIQEIAGLSDCAEKLANRVRTTLEVK